MDIKKQNIALVNESRETKFHKPLETIELQMARAHRKSFATFIKKYELTPSQTRKVLKLYDSKIKSRGKDMNIHIIYPVSMHLFTKHFAAGTLNELINQSSTLHLSDKPQPSADRALRQNPTNSVPKEPEGRKVRYLAPGISGEDLTGKRKKISDEPGFFDDVLDNL